MVSEKMYELGTKKSTIRTIFEYGRKRALEVGEENIYDFSIGNPNVPAPEFVKQAIIDILNEMEDVTVNSQKGKKGAPHIVSASFRGVRSEVLLHALEERGIYISAGSACSSNRPAVSATLKAMNIDKDLLESTVRFSFSTLNTIEEIEYCGEQLNSLLPMLRKYVRR